jgi:hypothetical protein
MQGAGILILASVNNSFLNNSAGRDLRFLKFWHLNFFFFFAKPEKYYNRLFGSNFKIPPSLCPGPQRRSLNPFDWPITIY